MAHHRRGLRRLLKDDALALRIEADHHTAGLEPRLRAILDYAEKLTRTPAAVGREDVEALRRVGFSDADVLHIAEVTAYYAFVNRIADGLGVELEPWIWGTDQ
ncbi:MAG TPA: peroxidase-related enzyme [Actinomycetota bacterium]|nr:peroxidase-related enzyme [Actinomycetota bacterium]